MSCFTTDLHGALGRIRTYVGIAPAGLQNRGHRPLGDQGMLRIYHVEREAVTATAFEPPS